MIRAFVIGHPIAHSRSPLIHGHWLAAHGIAGSYERIDVPPADLPGFMAGLRGGDFAGGNATLPLKEGVAALADELTPLARRLGAANTIRCHPDGRLEADNTDAAGWAASLDEDAPGWSERPDRAVVIGSGGAARAIVAALLERGFASVVLANRTAERAAAVTELDPGRIEAVEWADLPGTLRGARVVVNTTSLGMIGQPPLDLPLDGLPSDAVVSDVVYAPLETPLLAAARARGLRAVDGLGMLLHQAVPGFERFFGVRPAVTPELRALIVADLERTG